MKNLLSIVMAFFVLSVNAATFDEYIYSNNSDRQKVVVDYGAKQVRVSHFQNDLYTGKVDKYEMSKFSDVTNSIVKSGFVLVKSTNIDLKADHARRLAEQKIIDEKTARLNAAIAAQTPTYSAPRYTYTPPKEVEPPKTPEPSLQNPEITYSSYRDNFTPPVVSTSSYRHGVNVQYNYNIYKHVDYGNGRRETYRNGELISQRWNGR